MLVWGVDRYTILLPAIMSPLLILAAGWIAVGAADVIQSEMYNQYTGVAVGVTVFQSPAVGSSHCASLCQQQEGSKAFTFDQKVCTCHRNVWPSSMTSKTRIFVKEISGPCKSYTAIDDPTRDVNHITSWLCDGVTFASGWYRFFINGANAVMPTECVPNGHCGTHQPYWLDLQDKELPELGQELAARACGSNKAMCCISAISVAVRNCGGYYVYKLRPVGFCTVRFCAKIMN